MKHLAALVDRVTYMTTCELFRSPEQVPASAWPGFNDSFEDTRTAALVAGTLMERQLISLEECRWKTGVKEAMDVIASSAARAYEEAGCAARRARVMVRQLEMSYYGEGSQCQYVAAYQLGEQLQAMLTAQVSALGQLP